MRGENAIIISHFSNFYIKFALQIAWGYKFPLHFSTFSKKLQQMELPQDPFMLLSVVNMKLRDEYPSLAALVEDLQIDEAALRQKLADAGFEYMAAQNQFR